MQAITIEEACEEIGRLFSTPERRAAWIKHITPGLLLIVKETLNEPRKLDTPST